MRKFPYQSRNGLTDSDITKKVISIAIERAIPHALEVCRRPHVKAVERYERVRQFTISLRTFFQGEASSQSLFRWEIADITNKICNRAIWYDIGILESAHRPTSAQAFDFIRKLNIVPVHGAFTVGTAEKANQYRKDLAEVESLLPDMKKTVTLMETINEEADKVLQELAELFPDIEE